MNFFEFTDKELFFRNDGELVIIAAWGDNSLRVQSSLMDKIPDGNAAPHLCGAKKASSDRGSLFRLRRFSVPVSRLVSV